jgi:hypothetical protein
MTTRLPRKIPTTMTRATTSSWEDAIQQNTARSETTRSKIYRLLGDWGLPALPAAARRAHRSGRGRRREFSRWGMLLRVYANVFDYRLHPALPSCQGRASQRHGRARVIDHKRFVIHNLALCVCMGTIGRC